jgi:hypothetical protein
MNQAGPAEAGPHGEREGVPAMTHSYPSPRMLSHSEGHHHAALRCAGRILEKVGAPVKAGRPGRPLVPPGKGATSRRFSDRPLVVKSELWDSDYP